jgi:hypothetical protein
MAASIAKVRVDGSNPFARSKFRRKINILDRGRRKAVFLFLARVPQGYHWNLFRGQLPVPISRDVFRRIRCRQDGATGPFGAKWKEDWQKRHQIDSDSFRLGRNGPNSVLCSCARTASQELSGALGSCSRNNSRGFSKIVSHIPAQESQRADDHGFSKMGCVHNGAIERPAMDGLPPWYVASGSNPFGNTRGCHCAAFHLALRPGAQ